MYNQLVTTSNYQATTQWDLPPYRITFWLIDADSRFLLQQFDKAKENR